MSGNNSETHINDIRMAFDYLGRYSESLEPEESERIKKSLSGIFDIVKSNPSTEMLKMASVSFDGICEALHSALVHKAGSMQATERLSKANTQLMLAHGEVLKNLTLADAARAERDEIYDLYSKDTLTGAASLAIYQQQIKTAIEINEQPADQSAVREPVLHVNSRIDPTDSTPLRRYSALVLFDLDRFKGANDTYGHVAGDRMLQEFTSDINKALEKVFATTLVENSREDHENLFQGHGRLARIGGDEFTLIMTGVAHSREEAELQFKKGLERIRSHLDAIHVKFEGKVFPIVSSAGMHVIEKGDTPESAKKFADASLYRDKLSKNERYNRSLQKLREKGLSPVEIDDARAVEITPKIVQAVAEALQKAGVEMQFRIKEGTKIPDAFAVLEKMGLTFSTEPGTPHHTPQPPDPTPA